MIKYIELSVENVSTNETTDPEDLKSKFYQIFQKKISNKNSLKYSQLFYDYTII